MSLPAIALTFGNTRARRSSRRANFNRTRSTQRDLVMESLVRVPTLPHAAAGAKKH